MNKTELLSTAKPILFNTEMVQAILDGRKTVTRRVVKIATEYDKLNGFCFASSQMSWVDKWCFENGNGNKKYIKAPYRCDDILYVRETAMISSMKNYEKAVKLLFKSDNKLIEFRVGSEEYERLCRFSEHKWLSPYWLTKEAARIFLKVTGIRVERLQDITEEQAIKEGFNSRKEFIETFLKIYPDCTEESCVWVFEFERVS